MTTHPPHPPSEMVEAVGAVLAVTYTPDNAWPDQHADAAREVIRIVFAHVNRAAMREAMSRRMKGPVDDLLAAALAAAQAAALPSLKGRVTRSPV